MPVLPKSLILVAEQKAVVERHIAALDEILTMTPDADPQCAEMTMIAVSKMTMVLAGRESGEFASEAKGEAYMDALEDVPNWAVKEALRKWNRAECGEKYDYKWQPVPSTLRELALVEVYRVKSIRRRLRDLAAAEALIEFSDEHRAAMKAKVEAHLRGALSADRKIGAASERPADNVGEVFVIEGTPEWLAHQSYRRMKALKPLMARVLMDGNTERRGAYVETQFPPGYDEVTGEYRPGDEVAA